MSIAVISTGTELLKGTVLNTNLAFLGRELGTLGLSIRLALIAGDREQELYTACAEALGAADTLIISGGLLLLSLSFRGIRQKYNVPS